MHTGPALRDVSVSSSLSICGSDTRAWGHSTGRGNCSVSARLHRRVLGMDLKLPIIDCFIVWVGCGPLRWVVPGIVVGLIAARNAPWLSGLSYLLGSIANFAYHAGERLVPHQFYPT